MKDLGSYACVSFIYLIFKFYLYSLLGIFAKLLKQIWIFLEIQNEYGFFVSIYTHRNSNCTYARRQRWF